MTTTKILERFRYSHLIDKCEGQWQIKIHNKELIIPIVGIGPFIIPSGLFISCNKCNATYIVDEFLESIEQSIKRDLIFNHNMLESKELRFLRITSNLTQVELCEELNINQAQYARAENKEEIMESSLQTKLKQYYKSLMETTQ